MRLALTAPRSGRFAGAPTTAFSAVDERPKATDTMCMGDDGRKRSRRPTATAITREASAPTITNSELERGTAIDRYIVIEHLATGGMGSVYVAYDPDLNRQLALKLVRAGKGEGADALRARLLREAQGLAKLAHPNVVAIYDVGSFGNDVFLAMELVEGKTLRHWLGEERSVREIVEVMLGAGAGLAAAHDAGLVHRDFKPDNVLIGDDGRARVVDFGLVRAAQSDQADAFDPLEDTGDTGPMSNTTDSDALRSTMSGETPDGQPPTDDATVTAITVPARGRLDPSSSNLGDLSSPSLGSSDRLQTPLTRVGSIVGTPAYMAPEQHLGAPVDALTDQFSFCATLYEALYERKPFAGRTAEELARNICRGRVREPSARARVPASLRKAVMRGLSIPSAERFGSMHELLAELRRDTRRATRRAAGAVAGIALVGALALGVARGGAAPAPLCPDPTGQLDGVWDEPTRDQLKRAFAGTGRSNADAAFERVSRLLGAYTDGWVDMQMDSCRATRERGEQSEELFDLRSACLRGRLDSVRALVTELGRSPDSTVVERATAAAIGLPNLGRCADADALRAAVPPPEDPAVRQQVERLRARLRVARTLEKLGKYEDGLTRASAVRTDADALGYAPLVAEALVQVGDLERRSGEYAQSRTTLLEATRVAARARDAALQAKAWNRLLWTVSVGQREHAQALTLAEMAAASVEWAGGTPALRADHHEIVGVTHMHLRNLDAAIENLEQALALREEALGPDHPDVAGVLTNLGIVRKRLGDVAGARSDYERAIEINEAVDPDHPDVAATLVNLGAMVRDFEHDYEAARSYFRRAGDKWAVSMAADHPLQAYIPLNIGLAYQAEGNFEAAVEQLRKARQIRVAANGEDHSSVFQIDLYLGGALGELGESEESITVFRRALTHYLERDPLQAAELHLRIGEAYRSDGKIAASARETDAALAIARANDGTRTARAAQFAAAKALWAEGRKAAALATARNVRAASADDAEALGEIDAWLAALAGN